MMVVLGATAILAGAALAYYGSCYPRYQKATETIGGILLIGGFGLLGYLLEVDFGALLILIPPLGERL